MRTTANRTASTDDVNAGSTLDFGSSSSVLTFADSDAAPWSGILTITNWTAGADTFRVGTDGTGFEAQLAQMQFADYGNAPGQMDVNGFITPVPEPGSLAALGLFGLAARRRRS